MSMTELSIVNVNGVLSEELASEARKLINNITVKSDPKPFEALLMDDIVIITGNKNVTEHSKIYITNPRVYTDYVQVFDPNMQEAIDIIKKELDLNQTEMKELLKFHRSQKKRLESEQEDLHTRLMIIGRRAKEIKGHSIEKNLIEKLIKKNIEINVVMDEITLNKVYFTNESMEEVACVSEKLTKDVQIFLEVTNGITIM